MLFFTPVTKYPGKAHYFLMVYCLVCKQWWSSDTLWFYRAPELCVFENKVKVKSHHDVRGQSSNRALVLGSAAAWKMREIRELRVSADAFYWSHINQNSTLTSQYKSSGKTSVVERTAVSLLCPGYPLICAPLFIYLGLQQCHDLSKLPKKHYLQPLERQNAAKSQYWESSVQ